LGAEVFGGAGEAEAASEVLVVVFGAGAVEFGDGVAGEWEGLFYIFFCGVVGEATEGCVVWLEGPGVEAEVVASGFGVRCGVEGQHVWELPVAEVGDGFVLPVADHVHVVDAVGVALDVAVHHGGGGEHAQ